MHTSLPSRSFSMLVPAVFSSHCYTRLHFVSNCKSNFFYKHNKNLLFRYVLWPSPILKLPVRGNFLPNLPISREIRKSFLWPAVPQVSRSKTGYDALSASQPIGKLGRRSWRFLGSTANQQAGHGLRPATRLPHWLSSSSLTWKALPLTCIAASE